MAAIPQTAPAARVVFKRILYATDFSPASAVVLTHVASIARRFGSTVYIARVIEPELDEIVPSEPADPTFERVHRYVNEELALLRGSPHLRDIEVHSTVLTGPVTEMLLGAIRDNNIDLAILGTHGRSGAKRLLIGSVAEEVLRQSPCPVLTVGPRVPNPSEKWSPKHILFPTDLLPESLEAAPYAFSLAAECGAAVTVLHVLPEGSREWSGDTTLPEWLKEEIRRQVDHGAAPQRGHQFVVEFGDPAEVILKQAETLRTKLIVMGARAAEPFASHLKRSVVYKVVCSAPCAVLTVRGSYRPRS